MNAVTGKIVDIFVKEGSTTAKVQVEDSFTEVPLLLLMNARIGDQILIDAGIAISRLNLHAARQKSARRHVPVG
ncbi:MAG TPA: HypC/HybG/HupF family hydrogenase formation chaperone [Bacteroidota bacterium]|nr:HypC/HybG/HupF family hydrogenase formation chaperone [Bacteroidota bacterium]